MSLNIASQYLRHLGTASVGLGLIYSFMYKVEPGERVIIFDKFMGGVKEKVYGEGLHLYQPFK